MKISVLQKELEAESKALEKKFNFISELNELMNKYALKEEDVKEILQSADASGAPVAKKAVKAKPGKKTRKKTSPRPDRTFKHPKTGEVITTKAPHLNKQLKGWAQELKVEWQTLEQ